MATLNLQVSASADDGWIYGSGSPDTSATYGFTGDYDSNHERQWYRFTGVSGLSGVTVSSADLTLESATDNEYGTSTVYTKLAAEDAAAPGNPTSATDYDSTTLTTAKVDWDLADNLTTDTSRAKDIATIIQELADSYDPSTILILHYYDDTVNGSNHWFATEHYDGNTSTAPQLDIDYSSGGTTVSLAAFSQTQSMQTIDYTLAIDIAVSAFSQTQSMSAIAAYYDVFAPVTAFSQTQAMQTVNANFSRSFEVTAFSQTQTMAAIASAYDKTAAITAFAQTQTMAAIDYAYTWLASIGAFAQALSMQAITYAQQIVDYAGSVGQSKVGGPEVGQGMVGYDSPSSGFETTEGEN